MQALIAFNGATQGQHPERFRARVRHSLGCPPVQSQRGCVLPPPWLHPYYQPVLTGGGLHAQVCRGVAARQCIQVRRLACGNVRPLGGAQPRVNRQVTHLPMAEFSVTGGARVGWGRASWPFAKLTVSQTSLRLSLLMLGSYSFAPGEVVSLNRIGSVPLLSSGIQVVHNRSDYPPMITFWCPGGPEKLLVRIHEAGFSAKGDASSAIPVPKSYRMINALGFIVAVVAVLYALLPQCSGKL